jgi:hypothetical protein
MLFAANVAAGKPLVTAYREVYKPAKDKAPSVYQNAKRAAKHPQISAQIKALQTELLPGPDDVAKIRGHALTVAIRLSLFSADDRIKLKAATWLYQESEKWATLEAAKPRDHAARPGDEPATIIAELHALYRKALPDREPPLELIVEEVRSAAAAADEAEGMPAGEVELPDELSLKDSCETAAVEDVEEPVATTAPPPVRYRMERTTPAGFFPARFRKIPIP